MLNFKQLELGQQLFERLKQLFAEVELMAITESPLNPSNVWVNITVPADEDRWISLRETASDMSMDLLLDYGYHITINPVTN
jgi:hypothetical protein